MSMTYRTFGRLGWRVSEIGFGAWAIGGDMWGPQDDAESLRALRVALDRGVNFIDTAQGYGKGHSEELIGKVLRECSVQPYVATKVPPVPGSVWPPPDDADADALFPARYLIEQCEGSLRRLGREWLDVYQFHTWASKFNVADGWFDAMAHLKQDGKIRAIGVSVPDTTPENVIGSLVRERVDVVQVIYNIFEQSPRWNLFPVCQRMGTGVIVRVPFDEGALTGRLSETTVFPEGDVRRHYFRGRNLRAVVRRVRALDDHRQTHHPHLTMPQLALRFCLSHDAIGTVIPGIRNVRQAEDDTAVGDGTTLSVQELRDLERFAWRKDFWHQEVDD